ncbi:MAG: hypothetical protein KF711_03920 [Nitrospira sp.]|nr:hypothetical protein [Nitrospira sp.]
MFGGIALWPGPVDGQSDVVCRSLALRLFILATNAWMQHPVAYRILDSRKLAVEDSETSDESWLLAIYAHRGGGWLTTRSFVMAAVGATSSTGRIGIRLMPKTYVRTGVVAGALAWCS